MFDTVLIANRGEIAVRIIRTLRRMGIRSVAVYSDVDAGAPHVRAADRAIRLGPAAPEESYLHVRRVIEAAQRSGAQAVHPGYGFLSEHPALPHACVQAGVTFIGPPVDAIEAMADKARARQLMRQAGVPVLAGTDSGDLDDDGLIAAAVDIGLPIMVKPVAGGGGKGMTVVSGTARLRSALEAARRQARGAFGDDRLLLERFVARPRHIEVQILADDHGTVLHLGERECSLQRRHQKIIEEAPSPLLDDLTRRRIARTAVAAARACGYRSAGTVEFLASADAADDFFFLEMNTRLQVEHPVTEMVTGFDLVEWQIRVAGGEALSFAQADVRFVGHAIEARVYAEDPRRDFLPTGGTVRLYREPQGDGVRVDSGIAEGTAVPTVYDPLLAKVIAHGDSRAQALQRLHRALSDLTVLGVGTNVGFLRQLANDDGVRSGALDTELVERQLNILTSAVVPDHVLVAATLGHLAARERGPVRNAFDLTGGWRLGEHAWTILRLRTGDRATTLRVRGRTATAEIAIDDASPQPVRGRVDGSTLWMELNAETRQYTIAAYDDVIWISDRGDTWEVHQEPQLQAARHADATAGPVVAPMPGSVTAVHVRHGDAVSVGQTLVVLEAMKMEHQVVARTEGLVTDVAVRAGDHVEMEQTLLVIKTQDGKT